MKRFVNKLVKRRKTATRHGFTRLNFESLGARVLMAADIAFDADTGVLEITRTQFDDDVVLMDVLNQAKQDVTRVVATSHEPTGPANIVEEFSENTISKVIFHGRDGNDQFDAVAGSTDRSGLHAVGDDKPTYETPGGDYPGGNEPGNQPSPLKIPVFNSNLGAPATLFLDFNGHYEEWWSQYFDNYTPEYDTDGSPSSLNATEKNEIREIFMRVAEDFSPFNINVTTVDPGGWDGWDTTNTGSRLRVAIGGSPNGWYTDDPNSDALGVAMVGSYYKSYYDNLVYIFSANMSSPTHIAQAVSHETGHAFGLEHQNNSGSAAKRHIMPGSLSLARLQSGIPGGAAKTTKARLKMMSRGLPVPRTTSGIAQIITAIRQSKQLPCLFPEIKSSRNRE